MVRRFALGIFAYALIFLFADLVESQIQQGQEHIVHNEELKSESFVSEGDRQRKQ